MEIERKVFQACEVKASDPAQGIVEAIVSVFNNIDVGNDIVRPGVFSKSLGARMPKGVWFHDWTQPVAKSLVAEEWAPGDKRLPMSVRDNGGLYIKGQFNMNTQRGKEAYSDIQFGIIDEFSIGFVPTKVAYDETQGTRELLEADLYEWSPVLAGMNPETVLMSVKTLGDGSALGLSLKQHSEMVRDAIAGYQDRIGRLLVQREVEGKAGRMISGANMTELMSTHEDMATAHESMGRAIERMTALMERAQPEDSSSKSKQAAQRLYLEYVRDYLLGEATA